MAMDQNGVQKGQHGNARVPPHIDELFQLDPSLRNYRREIERRYK